MEVLDTTELWRRIPPEEKFELMAQAHASGVSAAVVTVIICGTVAVGLKLSPIMWGSLIAAPFVFQYAAGKAWRGLRPKIMLEYLAARSAARRYAFSANGRDLTVSFMFKGLLSREYDSEEIHEAMNAMADGHGVNSVWVALFNDSLVMMTESRFGASLEFAQILDDRLTIDSAEGDKGGYKNGRALRITYREKGSERIHRFRLQSKYPAALVVFEKKILQLKEALRQARGKIEYKPSAVDSLLGDDD